jgi:Tfp pilus assembly protein PilO
MSTTFSERYQRSRFMVQKTIRDYSEKPALRAYVEIFLTLTAISLFGIFAIRPTIITIGKLLQEIKAKEETLKTMNDKISNLNIAKDLYIRESEKIKLVEEAIPRHPEPDLLALQIEELAKADNAFINSLTIESTKIVGEPSPEDDQTLTLTLNLSGSYSNLIKFANDVESLRRPIKYDGLTISSTSTKDSNVLNLILNNLSTPYTLK